RRPGRDRHRPAAGGVHDARGGRRRGAPRSQRERAGEDARPSDAARRGCLGHRPPHRSLDLAGLLALPRIGRPARGRAPGRTRSGPARVRVILGALVVLAIFLRAHDIATTPPELFQDEISGAMSAWSVVTTGHDVIADNLPL